MDSLNAPVESVAAQRVVSEISAEGTVVLQPTPTAQDQMSQQIAQLWEMHTNFQGLPTPDSDSDTNEEQEHEHEHEHEHEYKHDSESESENQKPATDSTNDSLDAYAVHEHLTLAQSEIQVSLDIVRLLLAAKKQAAREEALQTQTQMLRHDQAQRLAPSFNALVGSGSGSADEVQIGGLPFAVGVLDTVRTERRPAAAAGATQFVLGAKHRQLHEAADTLEASARRLREMAAREARFWRTAFGLRRRNWVVLHQSQVNSAVRDDRYFVKFGFADCGSSAAEPALAEILRTEDATDEPLFIPGAADRRRVHVALVAGAGAGAGSGSTTSVGSITGPNAGAVGSHERLLRARDAVFDRELYHRLCREARLLELGSIRAIASASSDSPAMAAREALVTALSRDNAAEHFEWTLHTPAAFNADAAPGPLQTHASRSLPEWQRKLYASVALVTAAMHQRRQHREAKAYQLGHALSSRALTAHRGTSSLPDAFADSSASHNQSITPSGSSADPACAGIGTQRACAAWRRLVDEPIEVISHFGRTFRTPACGQKRTADGLLVGAMSAQEMAEWQRFYSIGSARRGSAAVNGGMAYVVRMRFQGGTVMAIRLDSHGSLFFAKGYFPPPASTAPMSPGLADTDPCQKALANSEQKLIHRVFRIVPLAGLPEFLDQLRRELQSLVLLRVAAALSRCSYRRIGKQCQMGQWYVHQSQLCVVGEWWQGARHRQIIGVAKWSSSPLLPDNVDSYAEGSDLEGENEREWELTLYFGPKHPTQFDLPLGAAANTAKGELRIPWTTCYPPPSPEHMPPLKTFEERLFSLLVSAF
ncbi:subunit 17 of mediator complex-domain-containing protein [Kickxella alabastrina]|uniref:subunit 17 of mediator complex-domain-containing protein n=1 Tax=Kickxella alabastrina TaxID=61397 RepID=UPI00221FB95C|nr:subunit 17 of mediator complex-domain-containing protein [Kickxella alabastrina]KAI7820883.1 subunit 17 of mediator complex-domain-containing protein [Kickxella alabastrina]